VDRINARESNLVLEETVNLLSELLAELKGMGGRREEEGGGRKEEESKRGVVLRAGRGERKQRRWEGGEGEEGEMGRTMREKRRERGGREEEEEGEHCNNLVLAPTEEDEEDPSGKKTPSPETNSDAPNIFAPLLDQFKREETFNKIFENISGSPSAMVNGIALLQTVLELNIEGEDSMVSRREEGEGEGGGRGNWMGSLADGFGIEGEDSMDMWEEEGKG
jgi:hypothetical protein